MAPPSAKPTRSSSFFWYSAMALLHFLASVQTQETALVNILTFAKHLPTHCHSPSSEGRLHHMQKRVYGHVVLQRMDNLASLSVKCTRTSKIMMKSITYPLLHMVPFLGEDVGDVFPQLVLERLRPPSECCARAPRRPLRISVNVRFALNISEDIKHTYPTLTGSSCLHGGIFCHGEQVVRDHVGHYPHFRARQRCR